MSMSRLGTSSTTHGGGGEGEGLPVIEVDEMDDGEPVYHHIKLITH